MSERRRLSPELLRGELAPHGVLDEVRSAIEMERRVQVRPVQVQVITAELLNEELGLWQVEIAQVGGAPLRDWDGATLWGELVLTAGEMRPPWTAEVLDAGRRRSGTRRLVVECDPGEQLHPGLAIARGVDFLSAPWRLVSSESWKDLRGSYERLLWAALGRAHAGGGERPLSHGWARVWGPPGTGKTFTLVQEIKRTLRDPSERVLVLSTTNRATDEIALRLGRDGVGGVLRVGAAQIDRYREAGCLDVLPQPAARMEALERARVSLGDAETAYARALWRRRIARLRQGLPNIPELLLKGPRCVVGTLHSALSALVSENHRPLADQGQAPFTSVFLDEAGLVPRATAAAAALLAARRMVLVGDPRQLSPICVASRSLEPKVKRWLAVSALENIAPGQPGVLALQTQYRMHPQIRAAVSALQYEGRLDDAEQVKARAWPAAQRLKELPRAIWLKADALPHASELSMAAERGPERSWMRQLTVLAFGELLKRYPELRGQKGLFVTPYRAQADAAQALLVELGAELWEASTVHAQQGAEAEVVVLDLVRPGGWAVPEWKRLVNVGISRAKQMVLVLASEGEMGQGWLEPLREELAVFTLDEQGSLLPLATQEGLFAAPPARARPWQRDGLDPAGLGSQIDAQRATRQALTRSQAALIQRDLRDLGPRVVRGVAGSGKTVVLARWAATELLAHPELEAAVLFGNLALRVHLQSLLRASWKHVAGGRPFPEERVQLVHIGTLLSDLCVAHGLPKPRGEQRFDWRALAESLREKGPLAPRFGLLYVDEAQDLGHEVLALLFSLVHQQEEHLPVRVFYDNAQNVYGRPTPRWADFGLDLRGRSTVLRESFRATRQAMELALDLLHAVQPLDRDPDMRELIRPRSGPPLLVQEPSGWQASFAVVSGQEPELCRFETREAELEALCLAVRGYLDQGVNPGDIRVLANLSRLGEQACAALTEAGIQAEFAVSRNLDPKTQAVLVTTPHSFKGYECEVCVVLGLDQFVARGRGPLPAAIYVALTRARTLLRVSWVRGGGGQDSVVLERALEQRLLQDAHSSAQPSQ